MRLHDITVDICVDSKASAKLKAISKHTQALAEELDQIDKELASNDGCMMCGDKRADLIRVKDCHGLEHKLCRYCYFKV